MVGNHIKRFILAILCSENVGGRIDEITENVDLIVAVYALHDRGNTLQPHAGIDRRFGQRMQLALGIAVVLHEHQVPDFDVAVAVLVRANPAGRQPRPGRDQENFRARAARAGIAHLPEIGTLSRGA